MQILSNCLQFLTIMTGQNKLENIPLHKNRLPVSKGKLLINVMCQKLKCTVIHDNTASLVNFQCGIYQGRIWPL